MPGPAPGAGVPLAADQRRRARMPVERRIRRRDRNRGAGQALADQTHLPAAWHRNGGGAAWRRAMNGIIAYPKLRNGNGGSRSSNREKVLSARAAKEAACNLDETLANLSCSRDGLVEFDATGAYP